MTRVRKTLSRFAREDGGSMIIFSMFLLITMLIIGGMAVDLVRFESQRAELQATLDQAALAAADLEQEVDPQTVVESYFAVAGLEGALTGVDVVSDVNSRSVQISAAIGMNTFFLDMLGMEEMAIPAQGMAVESQGDIEIILVLDVSGSMASNSKLTNLKTAAIDFVQTVLQNNDEERISIGIVPFNGQVNLGDTLRQRYAVIDLNGVANANCVDLPPAAYDTLDLATTLALPQTAYADTFSTTTRGNSYYSASSNGPRATNRWCPPSTGNVILLPTTSETALINRINAFEAVGATSINAGMRWGLELLTPESRPMFAGLIAASAMPAALAERPYDFDRDNSVKIVVLMTDGEHFPEERVNAAYRNPLTLAPIWYSSGDGTYSIRHTSVAGPNNYWVPHRTEWRSAPWNSGAGTVQLRWVQVWERLRVHWVAWQLYGRALGTTNAERTAIADAQMTAFRTLTPVSQMDAQLATLCADARAAGVTVFGIAFEAPTNGREAIASCASSPGLYFDAQGLEIGTAFQSIANQIQMLRLTE